MNFEAKRFCKIDRFILEATPERVFPLLCPKRELEWLPGWEYEMVYSQSGYNEAGCIFRTSRQYGFEVIWTCDEYDPKNGVIRFVNIAPDMVVVQFRIRLTETPDHTSAICLEQIMTGLSEAGNKIIEQHERELPGKPSAIEQMLGYYLKTGHMFQEQ